MGVQAFMEGSVKKWFLSYLGLSNYTCIFHAGDILALNDIGGSYLEDSFGASMSLDRARLPSVL